MVCHIKKNQKVDMQLNENILRNWLATHFWLTVFTNLNVIHQNNHRSCNARFT